MSAEEIFLTDCEEYCSTFKNATTRSMVASTLNQVRPFVADHNMQPYQMELDELQDIFDHTFGDRYAHVESSKNALKKFIQWQCEKYSSTYNGQLDLVDTDTIEKVRLSMVYSPGHLARVMDIIFNPIELNTPHNLYRALLWLIFMGFTPKEAVEIEFDDVNFDDMTITHDGKTVEICRESFTCMKAVKYGTEFLVDQERGSVKARKLGSNLFLCGFRVPKMNIQSAVNALIDIQLDKVYEITMKSIEVSGIFYRTYELERFTHKIDFTEASFFGYDLSYDPENISEFKAKLRALNAKYKRDYETWKRAFA